VPRVTRYVVTAICQAPLSIETARILETTIEVALEAAGTAVARIDARDNGRVLTVDDHAAPSPRARAIALRHAIAVALARTGLSIDLAVQAQADRIPPRLLLMDVDSTLITVEVIDELARRHGVGAEVAAVTERAMRGELDFEASLRARVSKLTGLRADVLDDVAADLVLSDGAARLITTLQADGVAVAIASGGFTFATRTLRQRLGLHAAYANQLEIIDGKLTGYVLGKIVTAARKADVLGELAAEVGISSAQTIAIGDGANDRLMLAAAGFGVAFRAKPALAAVADATIDHGGLDRVLDFLGMAATE
jgi:phosphoserine phosphatase